MHLSVSNHTGVLYLVLNFLSSLYCNCNFTAAIRRKKKCAYSYLQFASTSEKDSGGIHRAGKHRLNETEETVKNKIIISYNEPFSILVFTSIVVQDKS